MVLVRAVWKKGVEILPYGKGGWFSWPDMGVDAYKLV